MVGRKGRRDSRRGSRPADRRRAGWIWGAHTVRAALENPARQPLRLLATEAAAASLPAAAPAPEPGSTADIAAVLPPGAVHQGLALLTEPLAEIHLDEVCAGISTAPRAVLVVLDRAEDPRNVGAVLRAAAALGAVAVVVPERHAPATTGVLAKAASGALDRIPLVRVTNIVRALETLKKADMWCIGFDANAEARLDGIEPPARAALVLGAEGAGLRRLTRERCDLLVRVPMSGAMESLNLATAAAVALYEFTRER